MAALPISWGKLLTIFAGIRPRAMARDLLFFFRFAIFQGFSIKSDGSHE
jgi:hypothetical protein